MTRYTRTVAVVVAVVVAVAVLPRRGEAQETVLAATGGAVGGVVLGAAVTMGWIVGQATFEGEFVHAPADLIGTRGLPLLLGPAAGIALAVTDKSALGRAALGGAGGLALGTAAGVAIGQVLGDGDRTYRWAGGVMGAAVGGLIGAVGYGVWGGSGDDAPGGGGVPVAFRVRL